MLPKDRFVIEILESVKVDRALSLRIESLRKLGYRFALDDVLMDESFLAEYGEILSFVDIVKIDIRINDPERVKETVDMLKGYGNLTFLAEKVESEEEFELYKSMGCTLFQGYFFAKPKISEKRSLDPSKSRLLKITALLADSSSGPREIASEFEGSPELSLQLLQFLNSAHFSFKAPIGSIMHAVTMLGKSELLKWLYLLAYANGDAGQLESSPLVSLAIFRSKLLRNIARIRGETLQRQDMASFLGTLSLADTIFEVSLASLLEGITIDPAIKVALLEGEGIFATYLEIAKTVENAELEESIKKARLIGLETEELETSILESY